MEEFEDLLTDVHVEVKQQEWIQKSRKCVARLPRTPKDGCDVHEGDGNPNKGEGGTLKCDIPEGDEKPYKSDAGTAKYPEVCEMDQKPDKSDAGTAKYGDMCEGDGKHKEPVVSEELMNKETGDVRKDDESPSHFLSKDDNICEVKRPFKHDALHEAVEAMILGNTEETKVSVSPDFSEEDESS